MRNVANVITSTISISLFNRGMAGKVFEDVKKCGAKVVLKNNAPECVLLSPEEYVKLMNEVNDARLFALASARMAQFDPDSAIPEAEVLAELGITADDLDSVGEVEFE